MTETDLNGATWIVRIHIVEANLLGIVSDYIILMFIYLWCCYVIFPQLQLSDDQPVWINITPASDHQTSKETELIQIVSGVVSSDRK